MKSGSTILLNIKFLLFLKSIVIFTINKPCQDSKQKSPASSLCGVISSLLHLEHDRSRNEKKNITKDPRLRQVYYSLENLSGLPGNIANFICKGCSNKGKGKDL